MYEAEGLIQCNVATYNLFNLFRLRDVEGNEYPQPLIALDTVVQERIRFEDKVVGGHKVVDGSTRFFSITVRPDGRRSPYSGSSGNGSGSGGGSSGMRTPV